MCLLLREALVVGKIAIAHEFFSNELKLLEARLRIKDELSSYCVVTEPPKTTFGKVRQTYTGKLYGAFRRSNRTLRLQPHADTLTLTRQTGRPVHRDPTQPHRVPEGLRLPENFPRPNTTTPTLRALNNTQFFQESKSRNFRTDDSLLPQGIDRRQQA